MIVKVDRSAFKQTTWHQYVLRFAMGGFITVAAGVIANARGPVVGGLFLAFPAIFPATATLIARHEQQRKTRHGLNGVQRGISAAAVDAAGTALGSIGLAAFASVNWWLLASRPAAVALTVATAAWFVVAAAVWLLWKRRRRTRQVHSR